MSIDIFELNADAPNARRSRRDFVVEPGMGRRVEQYLACGMTHEEIADVLNCSVGMLRKRFWAELKFGAAKMRAEVIDMLFETARGGNSAARKQLYGMVKAAEKATTPAAAAPEPKAKPLGKKDQQALDAKTAGEGSPWGNDLGPRLVVSR